MKSYVSAILESTDHDIILQLRDDNPAIADPNCLSLFAGAMEPGETKEEAIEREIYEETTLTLKTLRYLFTFQTTMEEFGRVSESHVFYADGIDLNLVEVREGQGYRLIRSREDLDRHDFAPISKAILVRYFDGQ